MLCPILNFSLLNNFNVVTLKFYQYNSCFINPKRNFASLTFSTENDERVVNVFLLSEPMSLRIVSHTVLVG